MNDNQQKTAQLKDELKKWKTKYKEIQQQLSQQEPVSFLFIEALPDPVVFYDKMGNVLFFNTAFTETFGWGLAEVKHKRIDFIPSDKKNETQSNIRSILAGKKISAFDTIRYTKNGDQIHVRLSASAYHYPDGRISGIAVIYRDLTQNEKFRNLLIVSEEKYRSVMEAAADPIIVYDNKGRVTYFNPAFTRVFKWPLADRVNRKMDDFVPEENWPETKQMIQMVMTGKSFSGVESARLDKNGNIIPVSISASTYRDKNNNIIGSIINLQDIRKRKQAETSIKQKEKLKGVLEMAGAVCHELSQPAMIIEGYADLFLMNTDKDDPLYGEMAKLKHQVSRIGDLTQKLMNITKYETREYSKGKTIVDIDRASEKNNSDT